MSLWLFVSMEVDARGGTCLRLDLRWMPEGGHASASTGTKKGWTNKPNRQPYGIPSNDGKRLHACLSSLKSLFRCLSVYTFAIKLSLCLWLPRYPVSLALSLSLPLSLSLSLSLSLYLSLSLAFSVSIYPSLFLSLSVSISLSLCFPPWLSQ